MKNTIPCSKCNGTGQGRYGAIGTNGEIIHKCVYCKGTGKVDLNSR